MSSDEFISMKFTLSKNVRKCYCPFSFAISVSVKMLILCINNTFVKSTY